MSENGTTKQEQPPEVEASAHDALVIFPTHHDWIHRDFGLPGNGLRVLTYSPEYRGVDNCMLYRMMDASRVRICTDVTHWKIPSMPDGI